MRKGMLVLVVVLLAVAARDRVAATYTCGTGTHWEPTQIWWTSGGDSSDDVQAGRCVPDEGGGTTGPVLDPCAGAGWCRAWGDLECQAENSATLTSTYVAGSFCSVTCWDGHIMSNSWIGCLD